MFFTMVFFTFHFNSHTVHEEVVFYVRDWCLSHGKGDCYSVQYTVKNVVEFPVPSRDVTDQTLCGRE